MEESDAEDEDAEIEHASDTEDLIEVEPLADEDTRVLKLLYKGNIEEMNRCRTNSQVQGRQ